jgi:hypothetical protein
VSDAPKPVFIHVPRTGGVALRKDLGNRVQYRGHEPARTWRALDPEAWERTWSFGFVRDPWDRAVSYYYHRTRGRVKPTPERIEEWLTLNDLQLYAVCPRFLLTEDPGVEYRDEIIVSTIYRFEERERALDDIAERLGSGIKATHRNESKNRKPGYEGLFTPASLRLIEEMSWWEIDRFGYQYQGSLA